MATNRSPDLPRRGLTLTQRTAKRSFDVVVSFLGLALTSWIICITYIGASLSTGESGLFSQERVGREGKIFRVYKLRTMRHDPELSTSVTTAADRRITRFGRFLRITKIDELPQLFNVLRGDMSLVGPRPDVAGFADLLEGEDRIILDVRPGITGPATLKYRDEEALLGAQPDPEAFNRDVLFVDKVRINREYVSNYSFSRDLKYIVLTLFRRPLVEENDIILTSSVSSDVEK